MIEQAVILVGGLGTRLGSLTKKTPKPLIKIDRIPFLNYLIKYYSDNGIKKIVLLTKYKSHLFFKKYHNKVFKDTKIICFKEKSFLGTAGSLNNIINFLDKKFLYCNGDTFFKINLPLFESKFKKKFIGILACSEIQTHKKNRYTIFQQNKKKIISSGIYLFNRDKIKKYLIKKGSLENNVLPNLPKEKFKKISYKEKFIDIGTPNDLRKAKKFLLEKIKKKCVFLDRDGVINYDYGYVFKKQNFVFKKNVIKAIKYLNNHNYYVIVITNQSGIGRGYYNEKDVAKLHKWVNCRLILSGAHIDKFYYSPYFINSKIKKYRNGANFRKPNIGLFEKALDEFNIEKKGSFFIGDKDTDEKAAKKFNIKYLNVDNKTDLYNLLRNKMFKLQKKY